MMFGQYLNSHRIFKRLAKALIRLRVCAGWPGPLLVAQTILLEISCRGSNVLTFVTGKILPSSRFIRKISVNLNQVVWPFWRFYAVSIFCFTCFVTRATSEGSGETVTVSPEPSLVIHTQ